MSLISKCVCNHNDFSEKQINNIPCRICNNCGIIHQNVDMTEQQYNKMYEDNYHDTFQQQLGRQDYYTRYQHDYDIAKQRWNKYIQVLNLKDIKLKIYLDIGSGNNAFVNFLRNQNLRAYGVEIGKIAKNYETTFNVPLFDIHLPDQYFNVITIHDMLEHSVDPIKLLNECFRILSDDHGILIIDFPDFWDDHGKHHWRLIQHLWMFTTDQLSSIVNDIGFTILKIDKPIPGKTVFYLQKK